MCVHFGCSDGKRQWELKRLDMHMNDKVKYKLEKPSYFRNSIHILENKCKFASRILFFMFKRVKWTLDYQKMKIWILGFWKTQKTVFNF